MAGKDNLRTPSTAEARQIGAKGGKASAEARKRKKTMREVYESLRTLQVVPSHTEALQEILEEKLPTVTVDEAIMLAMIAKAEHGDVLSRRKPLTKDIRSIFMTFYPQLPVMRHGEIQKNIFLSRHISRPLRN